MVLGTVGCSRAHPYRAVAVLLIHENSAITRRPSVTHGTQRKTQSMENNCGAVAHNSGMVTRLCLHRRECRRIQLARNANVTAIGALHIATAAVSRVNGALTIFLYSMRFGKRMQLTGYSGTSTRRECAALASAGHFLAATALDLAYSMSEPWFSAFAWFARTHENHHASCIALNALSAYTRKAARAS